MNYQERVQRALDQIDESPLDMTEGDSFEEDGFEITCIATSKDVREAKELSSAEAYFVCVEKATDFVHFHYVKETYYLDSYGDQNDSEDSGFTFSMFCEVGQLVQPYYQAWLDQNGFTLVSTALDEAPWVVDTLQRKED